MKLKLRAKLILCGIMSVVTVGALGILSHTVHAESNEGALGDYVLSITPLNMQLGELKPGQSYTSKFKIINSGRQKMDYNVTAKGYQVIDESYSISTYDSESNASKIAKWITFDKSSGSLEANETIEVEFTVNVPSDAAGGGQYASIQVETSAGTDGSTIGATGVLSMPIFSHVSGNIVKCTRILSMNMNTFLINPPISGSALVENCGNVDLEAEYTLKVFPLFSDEEIYTNEEHPDKFIVLPDTKRYSSTTWKDSAAFGVFRVENIVKFGDQEQKIERLVVVCPIWLILIIIAFIGAVVFWLVARNRERKEAAAKRTAAVGHKEKDTEKKEANKESDKE